MSITTKNQQNNEENEKNKPISEMEHSVDLSSENFQMETEALKQKFKLDSEIEMKLNKLMKK